MVTVRKHAWADAKMRVAEICVEMRKREGLRRWREARQRDEWERRMAWFCIVAIARQIKGRAWEALKSRWESKRKM